MSHKSKFTFPMPSRRPKEPPTISPPLTKAQRILGTGQINIGSLSVPNNNSSQWDVRSTSGISVSVSESTASQATGGKGYGNMQGRDRGDSAGRKHGHRIWDQESAVIPRFLRTAHSSNEQPLNGKKSTGAISAGYLDVTTDSSSIRRQHSSSTIHSHYEKTSVPLSVSQQTSNSAIARGLPPKAKALLDVEGVHVNRLDSRKKKPPRLDLLMFGGRHRKQHQHQHQHQQEAPIPEVEPVLGNNYVMQSPSVVSPRLVEPHHSPERPSRLLPTDPSAPRLSSMGANRLRASSDTTHQLSDHYEQMLYISEPSPDLEQPRTESPIESTICGGSSPIASPPFFVPLAAPSRQVIRKRSENWSPTRRPSRESELSMFSGQATSFQPIDPVAARKDSASSISSRYTRTSKASRTDKSILDSDRQKTSVLSLSDTDSDEEVAQSATKSSPFSQRSVPEDPRTAAPVRGPSSAQESVTGSPASNGSHTECYAQLNDYLGIPESTPKAQNSRVRSSSTIRSNHSSTSTILPFQATSRSSLEPSCFPDRSTRTSDGSSLLTQLRDSDYTVREAKAVSLRPLVPTGGTPSWVPSAETAAGNHATPPQHRGTRTSLKSRSPEEPTPPMSPLSLQSIEIYLQSPEPPDPPQSEEPTADNSSSGREPNSSRFMAVTKQEEMLLAALRNKRAMMRENGVGQIGEEDDEFEGSVGYGDMGGVAQSSKGTSTMTPPAQIRGARLQVPSTGSGGRQPPKTVPSRRSSLVNGKLDRSSLSAICGDQYTQEQLKTLRHATAVGARPKTAGERSTSSSQSRSQASGSTGSRSRARVPRDRALMYLDHPAMPQGLHESANASDPVLGSRRIADMIEELSGEEYHESERRPRRGTAVDRSPSGTVSSSPSESTSRSRSGSGRGNRHAASEKRDEHSRRRHHQHQHQQQEREKVQEPRWQQHARADSDTMNDDLVPAVPRPQKQQLQRVSEHARETDDDPDGNSDEDAFEDGDDDEGSEIDFDAFPAPATHSSVFGSAILGGNGSANSSIIGLGISGIGGNGAQAQAQEDEGIQWKEQEWKGKGKGRAKEVERVRESADTFRPWSPFTQQQEQLQHMQRSETPTTPSSGGGHIRGKKSGVRLSAVGRKNSLLPWLGDDD